MSNLVKLCPFVLKILNGNKALALIKGNNSGTNVRKMTCNNSMLDLVNMNAYIRFGEILSIISQDIKRKRYFCVIKSNNSSTNIRKMLCRNPKLDLVNMNAYIKSGEILSICS